MDVIAFVRSQLPPRPARVLEVGCGKGELAKALDRSGYEVVAIDPAAPAGRIFRPLKLEDLDDEGTFDAVVASRSLHHMRDLAVALDRVAALLPPAGLLVLDEFGWDRLDLATAQWYHQRKGTQNTLEACCADWEEEHAGLHGYTAMRGQLDRLFEERYFEWRPYLYRLLDGGVDEREERALIDEGAIQALGFRYVGVLRD